MVGWIGHKYRPPQPNKVRIIAPSPIRERITVMPESLWCEVDDPEMNYTNQVGHPFSSKDPLKHHFEDTVTVQQYTGNSYGQAVYQPRSEVTNTFDMCGYHWERHNPFSSKRQINGPTDQEPKTLDELEREDSDYRRGYEAAMEKILNRPMTEDEREKVLQGKVE